MSCQRYLPLDLKAKAGTGPIRLNSSKVSQGVARFRRTAMIDVTITPAMRMSRNPIVAMVSVSKI